MNRGIKGLDNVDLCVSPVFSRIPVFVTTGEKMKTVSVLLFGFAFVSAFRIDAPAYAYLDPGTGSMIVQMVLGGVAGALVVGRLYWRRIRGFFTGKPAERRDQESFRNTDAE